MYRVRPWLGVALGLLGACAGRIDEDEGAGPSQPPGTSENGTPGAPAGRPSSTTRPAAGAGPGRGAGCSVAAAAPRASLLSRSQTANALRDLLGPAAAQAAFAAAPRRPEPVDHDRQVDVTVALDHAGAVERAVAAAIGSDVARFTGCAAGAGFDACAGRFLRQLGGRAFRRPLSDAEAGELAAIYDETSRADGPATGVATAVEAILGAPSFLYRMERGGSGAADPYETAAALSFFLRDSVPDDRSWAAAADGRLTSAAGVAAEVDRLLAEPAVRAHLASVVVAWTGAGRIGETDKDPKLFPEWEALRPSMEREAELFVGSVVWGERRGGLGELFTATRTSVDDRLGRLYGVPVPKGAAGFVAVDLPAGQRAGILTQAAVLAALSRPEESSVVRRGLWAYRTLLDQPELPPPPAEAVAAAAEAQKGLTTEAQLAAYRKGDTRCVGCHARFDPLGLLFEGYDAIGRHRPAPGGAPAPVDLSTLVPGAPVVRDPVELGRALAPLPAPAASLARHARSYAVSAAPESTTCASTDAASALTRPGGTIEGMFRSLALGLVTTERK